MSFSKLILSFGSDYKIEKLEKSGMDGTRKIALFRLNLMILKLGRPKGRLDLYILN